MNIIVGIYSPFAAWNIPGEHVARLREEFPHHQFLHAKGDAEAAALIGDADVAFMSELRAAQFTRASRLQWVHSPAAGVGGMLFPELVRSDVIISNSRGMSGETIAEHVLMLALALFRKLPVALRGQAAREWTQDEVMKPPPLRMLRGARVLVIGLGGIGAACAVRFAALGARVTGVRRRVDAPPPSGVSRVVAPAALLGALADADIVVVAAPQTHQTRGVIGSRELAAMPADAVLINVSRGKLVDEAALAEALRGGRIAGAGLDVFEHEPLDPASPLWQMPHVIITPHTAGFRPDHWDAATDLFAENLRRFAAGESLLNVVDKAAGY